MPRDRNLLCDQTSVDGTRLCDSRLYAFVCVHRGVLQGMLKILRKPIRLVLRLTVESLIASWFVKNRRALAKRFRKKDDEIDTTRPVGDRYVPIGSDREPSPFESAMADSAPPTTPAVEAHMKEAASHVRIDGD